ncbi:DUF1835 domain-containing protein [Flaviaesturariibacter flavus]|uniref:DUF1835 domain-containing protein n=1 Tax=Flaviaesturariibacter flavus TaxID=2502780 RepID=A0A4R1B3D9_9BACT|nr:DUF1835 domain-containing protein [Flaviaesturariibacter flavus]TCJ12564.1 DUF1835 domain-containing protein [Flaviaesturariibacter flavus]
MIHLVFQPADADTLRKAMEVDETLQGDIVEIKDDYAVGPLYLADDAEPWQQRRDWWKGLWEQSPYVAGESLPMVDDKMTLHSLMRTLDENPKEELWIWMGQNAHDVCGYYWLIAQIQKYQGRVFVLYMNNLPFINEKGGIFYPVYLFEIPPAEYRKAKKLCRKVTLSEMEVDPDEWKRLCQENTRVRHLEGGKKIVSKGDDFFDADILKALTKEPQKGAKAMHNILSKMKVKTGDIFLLWRMRVLHERGELVITGDPAKGWKEFDVRLPGGASIAPESDGISNIEQGITNNEG